MRDVQRPPGLPVAKPVRNGPLVRLSCSTPSSGEGRENLRKSIVALAVMLGGFVLPTGGWAQTESVVWKSASGVSVSGNSLSKIASAGWGNSGASSVQTLEAAGFVEFVATETNTWRVAGLSNGDTDQSLTDVDYGLALGSDGLVYVYEKGSYRGTFGGYSTGDRFRMEVGGGIVRYRKNGIVFSTSPASPRFPLLVDAALNTTGATLSSVTIGSGSFVSDSGVTVTGHSLTKTGVAGWNAGAISGLNAVWGDAFVEFTSTETNKSRAAGLSRGDSNKDVSDIDFALVLKADATVEIQEEGSPVAASVRTPRPTVFVSRRSEERSRTTGTRSRSIRAPSPPPIPCSWTPRSTTLEAPSPTSFSATSSGPCRQASPSRATPQEDGHVRMGRGCYLHGRPLIGRRLRGVHGQQRPTPIGCAGWGRARAAPRTATSSLRSS